MVKRVLITRKCGNYHLSSSGGICGTNGICCFCLLITGKHKKHEEFIALNTATVTAAERALINQLVATEIV